MGNSIRFSPHDNVGTIRFGEHSWIETRWHNNKYSYMVVLYSHKWATVGHPSPINWQYIL